MIPRIEHQIEREKQQDNQQISPAVKGGGNTARVASVPAGGEGRGNQEVYIGLSAGTDGGDLRRLDGPGAAGAQVRSVPAGGEGRGNQDYG